MPSHSPCHITFLQQAVDPILAKQFLTTHHYPGQRPLSIAHVRYLADLMTSGQFRANTIITFAHTGDAEAMQCVNGQHTLQAIIHSATTQPLVIETREVPSRKAIAVLYGSYDRGRGRSLMDAYASFADITPHSLTRSQLASLSAAIPNIISGGDGLENDRHFMTLMRNATTRYAFIMSWMPEMHRLVTIMSRAEPRNTKMVLGRAAVAAVALITIRYQSERATAFWTDVSHDEGLVSGDPSKTLLRYLASTPAVSLKPHVYARYVAAAWNAYYDGRRISKLYARESTEPLLCQGTPHQGKATMRYYAQDDTVLEIPIPKW